MNINITLFGQMITFTIFIWFTMKYVWPHITSAMDERQKIIAEGLEAAERGQRELELAKHKSVEMLRDAKIEAAEIIDQAGQRSHRLVEDAKEQARGEGDRLLQMAKEDIEQEKQAAKEELMKHVVDIAIAGAEKILQHDIDKAANDKLIQQLITEI